MARKKTHNPDTGVTYTKQPDDWYIEEVWAVEALAKLEPLYGQIYDPACGQGTIPGTLGRVLDKPWVHMPTGTDLRERVDLYPGRWQWRGKLDFAALTPLELACMPKVQHVVCNPPFTNPLPQQFIENALAITEGKVIMLLNLHHLAGIRRSRWRNRTPLARVWVSEKRISMPPGDAGVPHQNGSRDFAWFVWDRTHHGRPLVWSF